MKVLLVEDDVKEAALIMKSLAGFEARQVGSLSEAAVALDRGRPDVLLLDLGLPDSRGLDTLAMVSDMLPDVPVLVLVDPHHEALAADSLQAGAQGYLVKGRLDSALVSRSIGSAISRKRSESGARALLRLHQGIMSTIPSALMTLDTDLHVVMANRSPLGAGEDPEKLLGLSVQDVFPADFLAQDFLLDRIRAVAAGRQEDELSGLRSVVPGRGPQFFDLRIRRIEVAEGPRVLLVLNDVTQQRDLQSQVMQAMKMETVGQLAGGVAHDFNNILTGIMGYGQLLAADERLPADSRHDLRQITELAERGSRLTRQLLLFSRKQPLEKSLVNLNELLSGTSKMLGRLIGEHIELSFRPGEGEIRIEADRGQVEQVVMNLSVNARDAMPRGGKLIIETSRVTLNESYAAEHLGVRPGSYAQISVTDTGTGMDKETSDHMFEPFFTTKEVGKGTGLGLATVYGIVKEHRGNVWAYSELGKGTTFKIYLPAAEAVEGTRNGPGPVSRAAGGHERIFLVEDEAGVRAVVERTLRDRGYSVVSAPGPREAEAVFEDKARDADLLISDVTMPGMTGPELHVRLLAASPNLPVLFMSGYPDLQALDKGGQKGSGFIQKPFTPDALAKKVREILDLIPERS